MGEKLISYNPATGASIWSGEPAGSMEIDDAFEKALQAFAKWRRIPFEGRYSALYRFSEILKEKKEYVAGIISEENGKPHWEALTEVDAAIAKVPISKIAYETRTQAGQIEEKAATLYTRYRPHGPVAILGPFNFPLHLPFGHIVPALLAGNTIVFKPSEYTPWVGETLSDILKEAGIPEGVFNLVQGGQETGKLLAFHSQACGLFFTGSNRVGLSLSEYFGKHPEKILALEMGGNNPLVYYAAEEVKAAALATVQSSFLTTGQRCTAARRLIIVKQGPWKTFLNAVLEMASTLHIGSHTERPEPFAGPLISEAAALHVLDSYEGLITKGAISLLSPKKLRDQTGFLTAGILDMTGVLSPPDEEYFGPLLQLYFVDTLDEAIRIANQTAYGLSASLLSDDENAWMQFYDNIRAGVINWNMPTTGASSRAPFGGIGKSGNFRPSAFFAADYASYPVASLVNKQLKLPSLIPPGIHMETK